MYKYTPLSGDCIQIDHIIVISTCVILTFTLMFDIWVQRVLIWELCLHYNIHKNERHWRLKAECLRMAGVLWGSTMQILSSKVEWNFGKDTTEKEKGTTIYRLLLTIMFQTKINCLFPTQSRRGSRAEYQEDVWTLLEVSTTYIIGYSEVLAAVVLETFSVSDVKRNNWTRQLLLISLTNAEAWRATDWDYWI